MMFLFGWLSRFVFALRAIYWFRPPFSSGISWISSMLDICSSCKRGLFWQIQGVGEWERNVSLYQHSKILLCFSRQKMEENKSKNLEGTSLKSVSLPRLFWDAVLAFVLFMLAMTGWDLLIGPWGHFFQQKLPFTRQVRKWQYTLDLWGMWCLWKREGKTPTLSVNSLGL